MQTNSLSVIFQELEFIYSYTLKCFSVFLSYINRFIGAQMISSIVI